MKPLLIAIAFLTAWGMSIATQAQERGPNCFDVPPGLGFNYSYRCLPAENLAPSNPLNVAGISMSFAEFQYCQQTSSPYPPLIAGQQPNTAGLVCKKDDTVFTAEVLYTASEYLMNKIAVYICGPAQDAPGSEFRKSLADRFGTPASKDGYYFVSDWLGLEVYQIGAGGTRETNGQKTCAPGTSIWRFTMSAHPNAISQQYGFGESIKINAAPQFGIFAERIAARAKAKAKPVEKF
jgi:hypothetical protein